MVVALRRLPPPSPPPPLFSPFSPHLLEELLTLGVKMSMRLDTAELVGVMIETVLFGAVS